MPKKVLIISASFRPHSNSDTLAHEAERGAIDAGHEVEFINLRDKDIRYCLGCSSCQKIFKCVQKDDMPELLAKVKNADVLIFATPIYFYEMSGQLKTFLDRCNPLYKSDYKFRDVYLITASQDSAQHASDTATTGVLGWVTCFDKANLASVLIGAGVSAPGDILNHIDIMHQAYELGSNV